MHDNRLNPWKATVAFLKLFPLLKAGRTHDLPLRGDRRKHRLHGPPEGGFQVENRLLAAFRSPAQGPDLAGAPT